MDKINVSEMKREFNKRLNELLMLKNHNAQLYTKPAYFELLEKVKEAQNVQNHKRPEHYQRLKRFEVVKMADGTEKLIVPGPLSKSTIRCYVHTEEIFDILHKAHTVDTNHGGRNRMDKYVNQYYKNITREVIIMYLNLCTVCGKQYTTKKNGPLDNDVVATPTLINKTNMRCYIDVIDMQSRADEQWRFVLIYQDDRTKFIQLRPLKTSTAEEVAHVLLDIFAIFGAPCILQSGVSREFAKVLVGEISSMWPELKLVHGKDQSRNQSMNQEIENFLNNWLMANNTYKWSEGLRFVQMMKNKSYHRDINCSPFEAMFGTKMKVGLRTHLSRAALAGVESEENLHSLVGGEENMQYDEPSTSPKCQSLDVSALRSVSVS